MHGTRIASVQIGVWEQVPSWKGRVRRLFNLFVGSTTAQVIRSLNLFGQEFSPNLIDMTPGTTH